MSRPWPKVRLGEVLRPVTRMEWVEAGRKYRLLGVRLDGRGPFLREAIDGAETAAKSLNRVEQGDFIYSRLFAWRGAFGIIDAPLDGCFVSGEFPTFRPVLAAVDPRFLLYWFRLPATLQRVEADCKGSTPLTRNRFKERFFLNLEVPLPPLEEQRRITTRVETLTLRVDEARELNASVSDSRTKLLVSMARRPDLTDSAREQCGWRRLPLRDLMRLRQEPAEVDPTTEYPNLGVYSFGRGVFWKPPIDGAVTSARTLYRVRQGQFIYSRLFAFEGAYGSVPAEFDGYFVSNEFPTFDCNPATCRVEFLDAYFRSPEVWDEIATGSKGLGHRRQRVQPTRILEHVAWVPPLAWQERIVALRAQLREVEASSARNSASLDALLPSILNRAFNDEL